MATSPYYNGQRSRALAASAFNPMVYPPMTIQMPGSSCVPPLATTEEVDSKVKTKPKIPLRYTRNGRKRALPFPLKLMQILEDDEFCDIISWTPHGKSFVILRPKVFVAEVLPNHFKSAQYTSFTRKLIRWGFSRCEDGVGEFHHPKFRKGRFDLLEKMIPAYIAGNTDEVTEEDDDKEETSVTPPTPETSGTTREAAETIPSERPPKFISVASPDPVPCLGPVPGMGPSLSKQASFMATRRAADLLQMEMESLRLSQSLHVAKCPPHGKPITHRTVLDASLADGHVWFIHHVSITR